MGALFIIPLFPYLTDSRTTAGSKNLGYLNIYFAFSSTILGTYASAATTRKIVNLDDIKFGIFSGVLQIGVVGNLIYDPFVSIVVGFSCGIITNLFYNSFGRKIKNKNFPEINVIVFIFLFNSILGAFLIAPILIKAYEMTNRYSTITTWDPVSHMVYSGVSIGIGAGFGILLGLGERFIG